MDINHIAVYVGDLETTKAFYQKYFNVKSNSMYHNNLTGFKSYFLTFDDGSRLEIMSKPGVLSADNTLESMGYTHLSISVGSRENVDELTALLERDGYSVLSKPRTTGDGYYESCVTDPDGNRIELVEATATALRPLPVSPERPILPITPDRREQITAFIDSHWHGTDMLIRGEVIDMKAVDGFFITDDSNNIIGLITYIFRDNYCEITSFNSEIENCGIGTRLIEAVKNMVRQAGCGIIKLLTTNDNINAIKFYQKRGFELTGINLCAIDKERELKPSIPLIGQNGIPLRHEVEFEMVLSHNGDDLL